MRMLIPFILYMFILNTCVKTQGIFDTLVGKWSLESEYEASGSIILRSDYRYRVFNDMDFVGAPGIDAPFDIIMDDNRATALTEKGDWHYDNDLNQLVLSNRNFIKRNSEFSDYYGREKELIFHVESLTQKKLKLCRELSNSKRKCDHYRKNNSKKDTNGVRSTYREVNRDFFNTGNKSINIPLSGFETSLILKYNFFQIKDKLIVSDKKEVIIYNTNYTVTSGCKSVEIELRGVTELKIDVICKSEKSKWEIKVQVK